MIMPKEDIENMTPDERYNQKITLQKIIKMYVSKPVWQKDGSCKAVIALDFTQIKGKFFDPQFHLRADCMRKKHLLHVATGMDDDIAAIE